ncbi:alpha/beta-hydrolase, partial [Paxillus ammoniavirescens]
VNGSALPLVDLDVGLSWAGLLPIGNSPNEIHHLFFWFFPPRTNGGPRCSSLKGLLQEIALVTLPSSPFSWSHGQAKHTVNEYSWTNLSSILWVEQPVGTGLSQGTLNIENKSQPSEKLAGVEQLLAVFSELKGNKPWLTGECEYLFSCS